MKNYLNSFGYAFKGISHFFKIEFNARVHALAAGTALVLAWVSGFQPLEWLFLILAILLVFITEMFNTAIELFCDRLIPEKDGAVQRIKDISAGAVLIATLFAILIALVLFIPKWI